MDILCEEVSLMKEKVRAKLAQKDESRGRTASGYTNSNKHPMGVQVVSKEQLTRLRPITVASTNSEISK